MIGKRPDGMIFPKGSTTPGIQLIRTVTIPATEAATFHDTSSSARMFPTVFYPRGCNVENASKVKAVVKKSLVSVVGGINDPNFMEEAIASGKADFVVVGRHFIADPDWPRKARKGKADEIRKCIRCETCISAGFIPHVPLEADTILVAAGMRGTLPHYEKWNELAEEVIFAGDCRKASKILEAMRTGYCAGVTI